MPFSEWTVHVEALVARIEQQGPPTPKEYDGALSDSSYHAVTGRAEG